MKPEKCFDCGCSDMLVGWALTQDGRKIYPHYCPECGAVTTQQASKTEVAAFEIAYGEISRVYTATERRAQAGQTIAPREKHGKPCEVCKSTENVEVHHWAPAHLFGPECIKWPVGFLCRPCHTKWHQLVTPDMGKRKGVYSTHYDGVRKDRRDA